MPLFLGLALVSQGVGAADAPPLWGYGVKRCDEFVSVLLKREQGASEGILEYERYQDWLSGFVSGLNLATGSDVLGGVQLDAALRRIGLYCEDHRKQDFFSGATELVKSLSRLR